MKDEMRRANKMRYRIIERADLVVSKEAEDDIEPPNIPTNASTDNYYRENLELGAKTGKFIQSTVRNFPPSTESTTNYSIHLVNNHIRGSHMKIQAIYFQY